jgi:hypothetical protein
MRTLPLAVAVALLAGSAPADIALPPGGPVPNVGPPLLLRLEGVVQPVDAPRTEDAFTVVSLGIGDARRGLAVTEARTIGGDQAVDGKEVLNMVAPFSPQLVVVGPPALVNQLRDAPAGTHVALEGLVSRAARTYLLREVTVGAHSRRS